MKHTHQSDSPRSGRRWNLFILLTLIAFVLSSAASPIVFEAMSKNQDPAPKSGTLPPTGRLPFENPNLQQATPGANEVNEGCCVNWSLRSETGPGVRHDHAMAYDKGSGRITLFGGSTPGHVHKNDTWVWDSTARVWTDVSPADLKPSPRAQHAMVSVTSAAGSRLLLFGGLSTNLLTNDTWEWNGTTMKWTSLSPTGPIPSRRMYHAMVFDPGRGKVLLFGGFGANGLTLNDMWEWDVTAKTWANINQTGLLPRPRMSFGMIYDEASDKVVLFGGNNGPTKFDDTWEWDPVTRTWAEVTPAGAKPSARSAASMVYNSACMKGLLYGGQMIGGGERDEQWEWDGLMKTWSLVSANANGPGIRSNHGMAYDPNRNGMVLFSGLNPGTGDTWEVACQCADEAAPLDANGDAILPPGVDHNTVEYEDVEQDAGLVKDIYSEHDTSVDTWRNEECETSIGGTAPEPTLDDLAKELADAGITGVTPEEIAKALEEWEKQIEIVAGQEQMKLPGAGPVTLPHTPPTAPPRCRKRGCKYVFGGRDLVFVHGLKLSHLMDKMSGKPEASAEWKEPTMFPGSIENPEFYGNGYFKRAAEQYWKAHIDRFLRRKGIQNRYLIVSYSSNERLETAAHAILTQIGDAMRTGEGVVDLSGKNDRTNFGMPSYVVVSHCAGAPVTDVAMASAIKHPNLQAGVIARHAKAHISLAGAFSGSRMATAVVVLSKYIATQTPDWVCPVARLGLMAWRMGEAELPKCPIVFNTLKKSIVVDLVPIVMKLKWGSYIDETPVRTLTVVGAHPTFLTPLKRILNPGFDDGVLTINSQVANPNITFLWPSGFTPNPIGAIRVFDMGVASPKGLGSPLRAIGYYWDQYVEPKFLFSLRPGLVAGSATPYISPTGMVQPVFNEYLLTGGFNSLRRYSKHYSAFQSTSDHFSGYTGPWDNPDDKDYRKTFLLERNFEETRVITDPGVYENYEAAYSCDNQPLLDRATVPQVREIVRGRKIRFRFGKRNRTWWIWKRTYHLLDGHENKVVMDYVYGSVLTGGCPQCPPPRPSDDCNQNGADDGCDISNGSSSDCNSNGIPDSCDGASPVEIRETMQPKASATAGQKAISFTASATTNLNCSPLTYRWSKDGVDLNDGGAFSGTKTNGLTIKPVSTANAGVYVLTITNACGCSATASTKLTVKDSDNLRLDPSVLERSPNLNPLQGGTNMFTVLGGGSTTSPTQIGSTEQATFSQITIRYGRILAANEKLALEYTFDAVPLAVSSAPDFNVTRVGNESSFFEVEKTRRTIYGAGLSPLGFQLYFRPQSNLRPFVGASGGFLYFKDAAPKFRSARFNPNSNFASGPIFLGGSPRTNDERFNYAFDFGGGIQVPAGPRQAFIFGYKYHHFSNMSRGVPNNPGFDAHIFYTGYSFSFLKK
ncbi:MAG TPA: kelch repeat-containing protein [Pyrinomonadaceae bacterium]|nr:kelch repeat-containing protein [Pyrinomonadaceae bacterium]